MYYADSVFRAGNSHEREGTPCQDYSLNGHGDYPFGIVSDGCSSSGRTDIGSRIMCLSAQKVLEQDGFAKLSANDALDIMRLGVLENAVSAMRFLGLTPEDMDATLGVIYRIPEGIRAFIFGDGCVAARFGDDIELITLNWAGNMPGYPMYLHEPSRLSAFTSGSLGFAGNDDCATMTLHRENQEITKKGFSAEEGLNGFVYEWTGDRLPDVAGVFTDGVSALLNTDGSEGVSCREAIFQLTAVKSVSNGGFAVRRMNKALQGWSKQGSRPYDDISMALLAAETSL